MVRFLPMLAKDGAEDLLSDERFVFEPKLDGIRAIAYVVDGSIELRSRSDRVISDAYPEITAGQLPDCVLDGEIVLYDAKGNPDFGALLSRHQRKSAPVGARPVTFAVFDVLRIGSDMLLSKPIERRKERLDGILQAPPERFQNTLWTDHGPQLFELMRERGLEGVIAKRRASIYRPGQRSDDWRKVKVFATADVVITGFRADRRTLSSLEVAAYDDAGNLAPLGRVGTGFSDASARILRDALEGIRSEDAVSPDGVAPVKPLLVAEVRYLHRTRDGSLRHASFLRIRSDKKPLECTLEDMTL
jgi:bifunctional non-homologous end joining protein LigD